MPVRLSFAAIVRCVFLLPALWGHAADASEIAYRTAPKFALVIGNTRYPGKLALRNPERDARLIAQKLTAAGYTTELIFNADRATVFRAVGKLAQQLKDGGAGVLYYAGHGAQVGGINYLIPVDSELDDTAAVAGTSVAVDYLIERLKTSGAHLSLLLLDACRNDPSVPRYGAVYRGLELNGLAAERPANGMLVAYATQPGERALDGAGSHGPFARALADWLPRPGLPIEQAMKHVMSDVRASTRDEQRPWYASSMVGGFALVPAAGSNPLLMTPGPAPVQASRPARGSDDAPLWFENLAPAAQAELAAEIRRRAAALQPAELPLLAQQAKGGNVVAASVLGVAFRQGYGADAASRRDERAAAGWFALAADQQMPFARDELALLGHIDRNLEQLKADVGAIQATLNPSDARGKLRALGYGLDEESKAKAIEACDLDALRLYLQAGEMLPLATPVMGMRGGSNLELPIMRGNPRLPQVLELLAGQHADFDRRYMLTFTQAQLGEIPRFDQLLAKIPPSQRFGVMPSFVKANALTLAIWSGNHAAAQKLMALGARQDVGVDVLVPEQANGINTGRLISLQIASAREEQERVGATASPPSR